jgi:hypothetical protein
LLFAEFETMRRACVNLLRHDCEHFASKFVRKFNAIDLF